MVKEDEIVQILDRLHNDVEILRERGESDLRDVLHYITSSKNEISEIFRREKIKQWRE